MSLINEKENLKQNFNLILRTARSGEYFVSLYLIVDVQKRILIYLSSPLCIKISFCFIS